MLSPEWAEHIPNAASLFPMGIMKWYSYPFVSPEAAKAAGQLSRNSRLLPEGTVRDIHDLLKKGLGYKRIQERLVVSSRAIQKVREGHYEKYYGSEYGPVPKQPHQAGKAPPVGRDTPESKK